MFHENANGAPLSVPTTAPLTRKSTFVTPTSSAAATPTFTVPLTVAPSAGDVIAAVGIIGSAGGGAPPPRGRIVVSFFSAPGDEVR